MKSARIRFFSGTGNTRRACGILARGLAEAGYSVELDEVGAPERPRGERAEGAAAGPGGPRDLEVFAFPVYAFSMPQIMRRHVKGLERVSGAVPAAVLAVFGDMFVGKGAARRLHPGWEGGALREARRLLSGRGYRVFAAHALGYPESFMQVAAPPCAEEQEAIRAASDARLARIVKALAAGEGNRTRCAPASLAWIGPVRVAFQGLARRLLGKLYAADGACNGCGRCARACPAAAIRMRGKRPRWGWGCQDCQRCINLCPEKAIQTSALRAVLIALVPLALPYNRILAAAAGGDAAALAASVLGLSALPAAAAVLCRVLLWLLGATLATVLVDLLLRGLERVPGLRRAVWAGHTARYGRYAAPEA